MKSLFNTVLIAFVFITSIGCKKDNLLPGTGGFLKMKVDGVEVIFDNGMAFVDKSVEQLVINFYDPNNNTAKQLNILIDADEDTPITKSTYDVVAEEDGVSTMWCQTTTVIGDWFLVNSSTDGSSGVVQVTGLKDIGNDLVAAKGTFSGTFVRENGETIVITDGVFEDGRY
jgi:hypothetical protein